MISRSAKAHYICARCLLRSRRLYSSQRDEPPPSPPPSGAAKLTNRRLISLHGPDAPKFLQGIITANVRPESRSAFFTAFLTAQGKVLSDAFIYPTLGSRWHGEVNGDGEQGYIVDVDAEQADGLMKHLKKHKLRSKFKLRVLDEGELGVWSFWKEDERWTAHSKADNEAGELGTRDSRAPGMGQRVLLPPSSSGSGWKDSLAEVEEAPLSAYNIRRFLRGVAEGQAEIPWDDSLPMNSNIDIMGGIDFKKGCYVGQELTIRTHHTGVVRRRILPVVLYNRESEPNVSLEYDPNTRVRPSEESLDIRRDDKRRRPTGKYITGIGNVGLAMCRLEQMSDLKVSGEGSSFSPEDRFIVSGADGSDLGVKPVVPSWFRGKIREPKIQKRVD